MCLNRGELAIPSMGHQPLCLPGAWIPLGLLHSMYRWTNCNNDAWAIVEKCRKGGELLLKRGYLSNFVYFFPFWNRVSSPPVSGEQEGSRLKKQRLVHTHGKHLPRETRLYCFSWGPLIISHCLFGMSEIAGQFCSIKKYLKKLFLKNFVYIIDSLPKLKKKKKNQ